MKKDKTLEMVHATFAALWPEGVTGAGIDDAENIPDVSFDDLQPAFDRQKRRIAAALAAADARAAMAAAYDKLQVGTGVPTRRRRLLWSLGLTAVLSLAAAVVWGAVYGRYTYDGAFLCESIVIEVVFVMLFVSATVGIIAALRHDPSRSGIHSMTRYAQWRRRLQHGGHDMAVAGMAAAMALTTVACAPSPDRFLSDFDTVAADSLEQIMNTL